MVSFAVKKTFQFNLSFLGGWGSLVRDSVSLASFEVLFPISGFAVLAVACLQVGLPAHLH